LLRNYNAHQLRRRKCVERQRKHKRALALYS